MSLRVMKFGGTSVATPENREFVYQKITRAKQAGYQVVAVISAMGRRGEPYATDTLLDMALNANPETSQRELDMIGTTSDSISAILISANLQRLGHKAIFLSGAQAGIQTNGIYGDARVTHVDTERILSLLEQDYIPVVPGGQGVCGKDEVTLLGRGGSDTTACTLGVALNAESTEIYTDVIGMMTADPRIIPEAKLIEFISYENCIDMANLGAKVMHPRSVETAKAAPNMKLYVRSTKSDLNGTLICAQTGTAGVAGVALQRNDTIFRGSVSKELAEKLARVEVNIQQIPGDEAIFAVCEKEKRRFLENTSAYEAVCVCDRVSLVGAMEHAPEFSVPGITVLCQMTTDGYISYWVDKDGADVARLLHRTYIK